MVMSYNFGGKTILIAEDECSNYEFLKELLEEYNLNIMYAQDGKCAIDMCISHPQINLILMDIKMPILDGVSATQKIKEFRPELPIIAQTAYALPNEKEKFMSCGFDAYIVKPIDETSLLETIVKFLPSKLN